MKCLKCENEAVITKGGKQSNFCSLSCRSKYNSASTLLKRSITNIEKYGVDNPSKNSDIIIARNLSNIEKYGVDNPFKLEHVRFKQQTTMIEKYGMPFASQLTVFKEKQQDMWDINYGCHPWSNTEVREKRTNTLLLRYGVEHPILSEEIHNKIKDTCKQRYGDEIASKTDVIIEKIRASNSSEKVKKQSENTCIERYGATSYQASLIPNNIRDIIDNECELTLLVNRYGIKGLSEFLDISIDTIRSRIVKHNIEIIYKSGIQQEVLDFIRSIGINDIAIDTRKIIPPKELDFYIPDFKLAIEVNGSYWHSELNNRGPTYHLNKLRDCIDNNILLFFVWEHQWNSKKDIIKSRISSKFGKNKKLYARLCQIKKLSRIEKSEFFNMTHLQGDCSSSVAYGLLYDNKICAAMSFSTPRFNKNIEWELVRFSTMLNTSIVGGASKLFSYFIKTHFPKSIISYSDKQYGDGNLYSKLNFSYEHTSNPNYFYTKDYKIFENRIKYQKHKLPMLLNNFNPSLSEWQNMQNNGYDRIWDCGNDVWIWRN